jgi:hypothetical protein
VKPGPMPDPDSQHRGTVTLPDVAAQLVPASTTVPAPPAGLDAERQAEWADLWSTQLRTVIATTSVPALRRLFTLRQESADAHRDCSDSPLVEGSQEQLVLNPRCRQATELDKEIRQLEDRFGLNPQAFLKLGLASLAAEEAAARAGQTPPSPTPRPDPRG